MVSDSLIFVQLFLFSVLIYCVCTPCSVLSSAVIVCVIVVIIFLHELLDEGCALQIQI